MASASDMADFEDEASSQMSYKEKYKLLKQKLKFLIYENEHFQDALRIAQRQLLAVTKERSFLLDRLLLYEKVDVSSSESEATESSDDNEIPKVEVKRRKCDSSNSSGLNFHGKIQSTKKRRPPAPKPPKISCQPPIQQISHSMSSDGHMTPEEVERHLQSRQSFLELLPERAPPTVPTEMFSNDPSLDSESNDLGELETSPSNLGEENNLEFVTE